MVKSGLYSPNAVDITLIKNELKASSLIEAQKPLMSIHFLVRAKEDNWKAGPFLVFYSY